MLIFRDSNKHIKLDGDLLKTMTNYKFNVDHSDQQGRKRVQQFAVEMNFDNKNIGRPSKKDKSFIKLLKSPGLKIFVSGFSITITLSSDRKDLGDRLKSLLLAKQAGNNSDILDEGMVAIIDELLKYKRISEKQHKQNLTKCNLLHTKKN